MTRTLSGGSTGRSSLDRARSANGVGPERIDEEQELFDMDELGDPSRTAPRAIPSSSDGSAWQVRPFGSSPSNSEAAFGTIGGHRTPK